MTIYQNLNNRLPTTKMMIIILNKISITIVLENNVNYLLKSNCIFIGSNQFIAAGLHILTCKVLNLLKSLNVKINPAV